MPNRLIERGRREEGFSLIELLVVIVILGILASIVIFAVGGIQDKGQTSACRADYKTIQTAEEAFYAKGDTSAYGTLDQLSSGGLLSGSDVTGTGATAHTKYYQVSVDNAASPRTYSVTPTSGSSCTSPPA